MSDDPTTPPREPSDSPSSQPSESAPPPPPFEPDPELIGYLEREQRGAERR